MKELDHREEVNAAPVHRAHAGHKTALVEPAALKDGQRVFSIADRDDPLRIEVQTLFIVKEGDVLGGETHSLRRHAMEVLFGQALPAGLPGNIESCHVDQTRRLDAHPLSPIELDASP